MMSKKENYEELLNVVRDSVVDDVMRLNLESFLQNEIDKINERIAKDQPRKDANKGISETVLAVLAEKKEAVMVSELIKDSRLASYTLNNENKNMTPQKLTSILTQLRKDGSVEREVIKKQACYKLKERA